MWGDFEVSDAIVKSITSADGQRRIDFFRRDDGFFGYEVMKHYQPDQDDPWSPSEINPKRPEPRKSSKDTIGMWALVATERMFGTMPRVASMNLDCIRPSKPVGFAIRLHHPRDQAEGASLLLAQNRHGAMSGLSPLLNESRK